jgi:hypothetical protein
MPRYYFHVRDGETSIDNEGTTFTSSVAAKAQALILMGEILRDEGRNHWTEESWYLHVMDEHDETVCQLRFDSDSRPTGKTVPFATLRLK